jgi:hypothetical protein
VGGGGVAGWWLSGSSIGGRQFRCCALECGEAADSAASSGQ